MKRTWISAVALGALGLVALGLTGCEKKSEAPAGGKASNAPTSTTASTPASGGNTSTAGATGAAPTGKKSYVIGVIAKAQSNPVFQAARVGAEDAAKALGKELGLEIKIDWRTPNNEDAQQQAQFIQQLASQGVDGIALSATDAKVVKDKVDEAVGKGIAVATFDSDVPDSKRFVYYGVDDVEAGKAVMKELAREMGGKGVVAILAGNQNAPNLQARVRGVKEEAAANFKGISIKDTYYHVETAVDAVAKMRQVQTANPEITGWALVGGWPLYTDNALDGIAGKAKVVSMDPLPLPLKYLQKGEVQVLVGQPYYGWGYESVKLIIDKLHNKKNPEKVMITATPEIVTKQNAEKYMGQWDTWLGTGKK